MKRPARVAILVVYSSLAFVYPAAADVINDWNARALATVGVAAPAGRGPTPAVIIDLAMVHAAMHDAVQAYDGRFESYAGRIPGASGSSIVAVAKAAHDILAARFPLQHSSEPPDADYSAYIAGLTPAPSEADIAGGEAVGGRAAQNVLLSRNGDGSFPATFTQFTGGTGPGQWRPEPGTPGMVAPWAGAVRPFTLDTLQRCEPGPLPALTSFEYAEHYNEVKALGRATGSTRTENQGQIARMFSGNFFAQDGRLLRDIASAHLAGSDVASLGNRARLFALAHLAQADAFICSWRVKKEFNFWRPNTAIQNGDRDNNILTEADPAWRTYFGIVPNSPQNPNYPDYTSGANNVTGAITRILQLFFGSDKPFDSFPVHAAAPAVPLEAGDPNPRMYDKFSDLAKDVVDARVYLGIHFRFADTEGRSQGRRVAGYAFRNFLQPIN